MGSYGHFISDWARRLSIILLLMTPLLATLTSSYLTPLELTECFEEENEQKESDLKIKDIKLLKEGVTMAEKPVLLSPDEVHIRQTQHHPLQFIRTIPTPPPEVV